ncbi:MAG: hypothetical protein IJ763_10105 [Lachnospiraceae bacterium]|nr:hypothetical protein [Lachnospiraceae bacterium]
MNGIDIEIDKKTGLPLDKSYMEYDLPPFLETSLNQMKETWKKLDLGIDCDDWDCDYCDLQSSINVAEVENLITSQQAWYLRERYLKIERREVI